MHIRLVGENLGTVLFQTPEIGFQVSETLLRERVCMACLAHLEAEYERMLAHAYPAATPASLKRMAQYGVRKTEDGRYVLRMDTSFRGAVAGAEADAAAIEARHEAYREEMWSCLEKIDVSRARKNA